MNLNAPDKIQNFIVGEFCPLSSGRYIDNVNPATGQVYSSIPDSNADDVPAAATAAKKAFDSWRLTAPETRFKLLNRIAELIDENSETLALAETNDNGKPLWLSKKVDIPRAS